MSEQLDKLVGLPVAARFGVLGGAIAAIIGGYWMLLYKPLGDELATVQEQASVAEQEVTKRAGIVANLPRYEAEVERLNVELKKALSELPDKKEIASLLDKIADKAKASGLDVKNFRPKGEQKKDFYAEVPVEIEVAGGFHQVATFFDEVSDLDRIVNIEQFSISQPKQSEYGMVMKTSLVATSFRFLDEGERPKPDEKLKKKPKKKAATADAEG